ncbi:MBL fold metallo-hydrolase [Aspergillus novofumigatus IBT 16806]|uniref:Putative Zn-dependent hydrolases of the beta-lactamase protein n=1 Tax=Aspergillus novofumigatus (strain IBT 16806) TaxID=1392255 RepID=A0A2I1BWT5_ASPN1|nr:putative Zn-dependent hydrolases of the beta-lactamase protein [Aspergillus novofumigatus IBT 16806]PKX89839.1 putative Zn-dependent hydrolases of the beta-lactamase protein [Aspergillus novofumigatus IBT 16806]
MAPKLNVTHIGTATAILEIDGVNMLTDPFFSPAGSSWPVTETITLQVSDDPALRLDQLPVIDAVLLSHEDHVDNLDELEPFPRPGVHGLKPWEKIDTVIAGKKFQIIGTPTQHIAGDECTGFIITNEEFGRGRDGLPNAIWFTGDTVYIDELKKVGEQYHVLAAIMNLGNAYGPVDKTDPSKGACQITMDGKSGARLFRDVKADVLVPMHYESWGHFTQFGKELRKDLEEEGIIDKVCWLTPGKPVSVL